MPAEKLNKAVKPLTADHWQTTPEATGGQPSPVMQSWLAESGLITSRLRSACGAPFSLEVLNQSTPGQEKTAHRQIVLWCGETPCIYAETLIPAETANAFPWLLELGDEPLGERLSTQPDVQRSAFRYSFRTPASVPVAISNGEDYFWARRSDFQLGHHSLTVTEVFLPGINSCEESSTEMHS